MSEPVLIIGAGLTGLTLAWRLRREGRRVLLVDRSDRVGGAIRTTTDHGLIFEHGPQAFRGGQLPPWRLVEALGLTDQVVEASEAAQRRFLLRHGALHPLSPSLLKSRAILRRRDWLRVLAEVAVPRAQLPGETVWDFTARRFGARFADELGDAMIAGITGGDPRELEVSSVFTALWELEQAHGGVLRGALRRKPAVVGPPARSWTFRRGMSQLTDALAADLGDTLRLNTAVTGLWPEGDGWRVDTDRGPLAASEVVVACPAQAAAAWLPELATPLRALSTAPIATLHLAWPRGTVPARDGFGWLTSSLERHDVLGCIWVTATFPGHAPNHEVVRLMIGGRRGAQLVGMSDAALVDHARDVLLSAEGVSAMPSHTHIVRHEPGIPQYTPGHRARVAELADAWPGLSFLGWSVTGISLHQSIDAALTWRG